MRYRYSAQWALGLLLLAAFASPALGKEPKTEDAKAAEIASKYLRLVRDAQGEPISMDTSIVKYVPKDEMGSGVSVDLISAVHIGEKSYYEELNKAFEEYDVLLYELVAPEGTRVPKGGGETRHPIGALQQGMKDVLELEYQLSEVDYSKPNFVHADMSPEQFAKSMKDRGESVWGIFFKMMGQGIVQQSQKGGSSDVEMLMAMFDKNRALKLKRVMAKQFEDLDQTMTALDGPEGSTIITERNKAALAVLKKQIDAGKKRIGIFYGAGHMPDIHKRLESEFSLKPDGERWLVAWKLAAPAPGN